MNNIYCFMFVSFVFFMMGCTDDLVVNEVYSPPHEDENFSGKLLSETRKAELYDNFETVYIINATLLTEEILEPMSVREKDLNTGSRYQKEIDEKSVGFFLSVFEPDGYLKSFDRDIWDVFIILGDERILFWRKS